MGQDSFRVFKKNSKAMTAFINTKIFIFENKRLL